MNSDLLMEVDDTECLANRNCTGNGCKRSSSSSSNLSSGRPQRKRSRDFTACANINGAGADTVIMNCANENNPNALETAEDRTSLTKAEYECVSLSSDSLNQSEVEPEVSCINSDDSGSTTGSNTSSLDRRAISDNNQKQLLIREMVDTEQTFVADLGAMIKGYAESISKLSPDLESIFNILNVIQSLNSQLLERLRVCQFDGVAIGRVFLDMAPSMHAYSDYCICFPRALSAISSLNSVETTASLLVTCQKKLGHTLALPMYLLKPVQRVLKYQLFLQKLSECFEDPDGIINRAISEVCSLQRRINSSKGKHEMELRLQELQTVVHDLDVCDVSLENSGPLIKEGTLFIGKASPRHVILLNKLLLICKQRDELSINCKTAFKCSQLMVLSQHSDANSFQLIDSKNPKQSGISLQARTVTERKAWVEAILSTILSEDNFGKKLPDAMKEKILNFALSDKSAVVLGSFYCLDSLRSRLNNPACHDHVTPAVRTRNKFPKSSGSRGNRSSVRDSRRFSVPVISYTVNSSPCQDTRNDSPSPQTAVNELECVPENTVLHQVDSDSRRGSIDSNRSNASSSFNRITPSPPLANHRIYCSTDCLDSLTDTAYHNNNHSPLADRLSLPHSPSSPSPLKDSCVVNPESMNDRIDVPVPSSSSGVKSRRVSDAALGAIANCDRGRSVFSNGANKRISLPCIDASSAGASVQLRAESPSKTLPASLKGLTVLDAVDSLQSSSQQTPKSRQQRRFPLLKASSLSDVLASVSSPKSSPSPSDERRSSLKRSPEVSKTEQLLERAKFNSRKSSLESARSSLPQPVETSQTSTHALVQEDEVKLRPKKAFVKKKDSFIRHSSCRGTIEVEKCAPPSKSVKGFFKGLAKKMKKLTGSRDSLVEGKTSIHFRPKSSTSKSGQRHSMYDFTPTSPEGHETKLRSRTLNATSISEESRHFPGMHLMANVYEEIDDMSVDTEFPTSPPQTKAPCLDFSKANSAGHSKTNLSVSILSASPHSSLPSPVFNTSDYYEDQLNEALYSEALPSVLEASDEFGEKECPDSTSSKLPSTLKPTSSDFEAPSSPGIVSQSGSVYHSMEAISMIDSVCSDDLCKPGGLKEVHAKEDEPMICSEQMVDSGIETSVTQFDSKCITSPVDTDSPVVRRSPFVVRNNRPLSRNYSDSALLEEQPPKESPNTVFVSFMKMPLIANQVNSIQRNHIHSQNISRCRTSSLNDLFSVMLSRGEVSRC